MARGAGNWTGEAEVDVREQDGSLPHSSRARRPFRNLGSRRTSSPAKATTEDRREVSFSLTNVPVKSESGTHLQTGFEINVKSLRVGVGKSVIKQLLSHADTLVLGIHSDHREVEVRSTSILLFPALVKCLSKGRMEVLVDRRRVLTVNVLLGRLDDRVLLLLSLDLLWQSVPSRGRTIDRAFPDGKANWSTVDGRLDPDRLRREEGLRTSFGADGIVCKVAS